MEMEGNDTEQTTIIQAPTLSSPKERDSRSKAGIAKRNNASLTGNRRPGSYRPAAKGGAGFGVDESAIDTQVIEGFVYLRLCTFRENCSECTRL